MPQSSLAVDEYAMNGCRARSARRSLRLALRNALLKSAGPRSFGLWLLLLTPSLAWALVGPAREAPEYSPYAVMVLNRRSADFCTAGVIAPDAVLTAAHCAGNLADTKVFFRGPGGKLIFVDAAAISINPAFKPKAARKRQISIDLALVRTVTPLPSEFKPLQIEAAAGVIPGQAYRILGYGRASEDVRGTSGVLRSGILTATGPKSPLLAWLADPHGTGLGGCTGDSGGPILALDKPALVAVAIRAKGAGGYYCGAVTEAVLIAPQLPWLEETLRSWGEPLGGAK
jgi:hypothetical protein